jgi:hypothetical protein
MSIANQNIGKLHHYDNPQFNTEFDRIYDFLARAKFPDNSVNGRKLQNGSVPETKLIGPLSTDVAPGIPATPHRTDAEINALIEASVPIRFQSYASIRDEKPNGTAGGTFTSGAWRTRDLTTIAEDDDSLIVSLVANQFTLVPNEYYVRIKCPSLRVQSNIARLYNADTGLITLVGTNEYSEATPVGSHSSTVIQGFFTIGVNTLYEVQHHCFLTRTLHGFGGSVLTSVPQPVEVYTTVELWSVDR